MGNEWMNLYRKNREPEVPQIVTRHASGPVLYYNERVIDHFTNPRNVGELEHPDGEAVVGDPSCGDQLKVGITVKNNKITDIRFQTFGCPGAIATSSMMTVIAKGLTLEQALNLNDDHIISALGGIPERKKHCSLLGISGLHQAIKAFYEKQKSEAK